MGLGALATIFATPQYQSSTQLYVSVRSEGSQTGELVQGSTFARQIVASYVDVVRTGVVLDPVIEELNLQVSSGELAEFVTASSPLNTVLINISATSSDA